MSKLTIEIPESLRKSVADLAAKEGDSIDQFLGRAAAEKLSVVRTLDYPLPRSRRGASRRF